MLPAWKQRLLDVSPLLRRHLLPDVLPIAQSLLLLGSQAVPSLQALANLRLLFRRQAVETLIVPQKLLLLVRRQVLKPLHGLGRQFIRVPAGRQRIRQIRPHRRLWPDGALRTTLLLGCRFFVLTVRGTAKQPCRQPGSQDSAELESSPHYLVTLFTSSVDAAGDAGSSESASNFETTS